MAKLMCFLIRAYQASLSAYLGGQCRFVPSCSHYAQDCFQQLSFFKALKLVMWRMLRCQPFSKGGYDYGIK